MDSLFNSNFKSRITITSKDEFKELGEAINFMAEKLEQNYHQVVVKKPVVDEVKTINNNEVLLNIQSLLGSVSTLVDSIAESNKDEALQKQAELIKEIERELSKSIKA